MSAIIQQPDALSFSGNLKKFIVSSTADVSVQLLKGSTLLLNEVYTPGAGNLAEIDLRKIIHQELSINIPTNGAVVTKQTDGMAQFTVQIDTLDPVVFTVIKGGVFRLANTATEWLTSNNQSWQPQVKRLVYDQPEWICRYATEKLWVRATAYFADGNTEEIDLAVIEAGKLCSIDCSYAAMDTALTGSEPVAWDVSFLANSGELRGYVQRYQLRTKKEQEHLFAWVNTLGGIDTVSFTGHRQDDAKVEPQVATLYDETLEEYDDETKREIEQSTGYMDWYESKWLEDFFLSPKKYEVDELGGFYRIAMTESEVVTTTQDDVYEFLITFRRSDELPFLNLKRENMTFPAFIPDDISLPPLMRDLPIANADGSYIIAVQDPNSSTWYQMSIDQLMAMFACPCDGSSPGTTIGTATGFEGSIVYKSGLTHRSVGLVGIINGQRYPVIDQDITVEPDPNLPVIVIFVVDTYNNLLPIYGTPNANPQKPTPGPNQVEITHVYLDAAALEPSNVVIDKVYDEGAVDEWAGASTSDADITVDLADETSPYNGTKAISVELAIPDATGEAPTHKIGDLYAGGRIFYLYPGGQKGLVAALEDQSASAPYQYSEYTNGTQDNVGIGMGAVNTAVMMAAAQSNQVGMAAPLSVYYRGGGYDDWHLPSRDELALMRFHKAALGGFTNGRYWSSTEAFSDSRKRAVGVDFAQATGYFNAAKGTGYRVRAIRAFDDTQQSYTEPVTVYSPTNTKIEFTAPATRELNSAILSFWMKTSKAWLGNTALLIETFLNGVKTGGTMIQGINAAGFDANNTEDWQQVVIQAYNFGLTTKQCDKLRISPINSWPNGVVLQLDSIRIQTDPEQAEAEPDFGYRSNQFTLEGAGPHAIQFREDRYMADTNYFPLVKAFQDGFEVGYANITKRIDGFDITFNEGGTHTGEYLILKYF